MSISEIMYVGGAIGLFVTVTGGIALGFVAYKIFGEKLLKGIDKE